MVVRTPEVPIYIIMDIKKAVATKDMKSVMCILAHPSFDEFTKVAYGSVDGFAIRVNPFTCQKEMMIAGTRDAAQWALNLTELVLSMDSSEQLFGPATSAALKEPRERKTAFFESIANTEQVDVIYGHSRGGAIVADMNTTAFKVGLDAAMVIAENKDMINFNEGGTGSLGSGFDGLIGLTGKNNVSVDLSEDSMHKVWKVY